MTSLGAIAVCAIASLRIMFHALGARRTDLALDPFFAGVVVLANVSLGAAALALLVRNAPSYVKFVWCCGSGSVVCLLGLLVFPRRAASNAVNASWYGLVLGSLLVANVFVVLCSAVNAARIRQFQP